MSKSFICLLVFTLSTSTALAWATDASPGRPGSAGPSVRPGMVSPSPGAIDRLDRYGVAGVDRDVDERDGAVAPLWNSDDIYWKTELASGNSIIDKPVRCVIEFSGQLVAAGDFTRAGGKTVGHIAAWDGTKWEPLGDGVNGSVYSLAVYKNRLIAGGEFDFAGGVPANNVAEWDGSSWSAIGAGTNGRVMALCESQGRLIAGGDFGEAGGAVAVGVASWSGTAWSDLGSDIVGHVNALTVYDNEVIAGGEFTVGSVPEDANVAAWDGHSWHALIAGIETPVTALTVRDDELFVGGFRGIGWWGGYFVVSLVASWDGVSWTDMTDGFPMGTEVHSIAAYDDEVVVGGITFYNCIEGGYSVGAIVSWKHGSWSPVAGGLTSSTVRSLAVIGDRLIAAGDFISLAGKSINRIGSWDGSSWSGLGSVLRPGSCVTVYDGRLLGEGSLANLGRDYDGDTGLAEWNGTSWRDLGPRAHAYIGCICIGCCTCVIPGWPLVSSYVTYHDKLVLGGYSLGATTWNESAFTSIGPTSGVSDLAIYHDRVFAVGDFWLPGVGRSGIAAWDGQSWSALGGDFSSLHSFLTMTVYDDRLIVGGRFETASGVPANNVAAWDDNNWSALGDGTDNTISALTVYQGKLIAAGVFTSAAGVSANHIAAWDGSSWQALGAGIDGNGWTFKLAVYNGMLMAGGGLTAAGGQPVNHIAAWNGSEWHSLGSGVDGQVNDLAIYHDGLIVTGDFMTAGGKVSPGVAVWSKKSDGTVAFDVRPGSCSSPLVENPGRGQGKAVVTTAILGSPDVDVHDIDPQSVSIHGSPPVRWSYGDVGAPADRSSDECACNDARPDGHEDLVLSFYSDDLLAAIEVVGGVAPGSTRKHERQIVRVTGEFRDGSDFEGSDCVTLVGTHGPSLSARGADTNRHSELLDNVPNPFNPETKIGFYLSEPAHVKLEIFNVRGQRVATLLDEFRDLGEQWITWKASGVASGVYFYRLHAGDFVETKRMLLLK